MEENTRGCCGNRDIHTSFMILLLMSLSYFFYSELRVHNRDFPRQIHHWNETVLAAYVREFKATSSSKFLTGQKNKRVISGWASMQVVRKWCVRRASFSANTSYSPLAMLVMSSAKCINMTFLCLHTSSSSSSSSTNGKLQTDSEDRTEDNFMTHKPNAMLMLCKNVPP